MKGQLDHYCRRLQQDRIARPGRAALLGLDDELLAVGAEDLCRLGAEVAQALGVAAVALAECSLPFGDFLIRRAAPDQTALQPRDTETRTFLHQIPFLRRRPTEAVDPAVLARLLATRKGVLVEGLGIVAVGAVTPQQAYVNVSSVFHALVVKYLLDLLREGYRFPAERAALADFRTHWPEPGMAGLDFRPGPLAEADEILDELARVGRYTVERHLVDSFFGNVSCRSGNLLYISQTAASLDALAGCIDPVPFDDSSTAGLTASSELPAHRRIYETTDARTILHGHPRFAVVMSMLCGEEGCNLDDCWRDCPRVRFLGDTPVVAGEVGAGGLARRVAPVIGAPGRAIVYGHGVFAVGRSGFAEPFRALVEVERWCRAEYFRRLAAAQP